MSRSTRAAPSTSHLKPVKNTLSIYLSCNILCTRRLYCYTNTIVITIQQHTNTKLSYPLCSSSTCTADFRSRVLCLRIRSSTTRQAASILKSLSQTWTMDMIVLPSSRATSRHPCLRPRASVLKTGLPPKRLARHARPRAASFFEISAQNVFPQLLQILP